MPTPSRTLRYQRRQRLRELFRTCQWRILIACYKTGVEKKTAFPERVPGQLANAPTEETTRLCADDIWRKRLYWQGHIDVRDSSDHDVAVMQTPFLIPINDFITVFVSLSDARVKCTPVCGRHCTVRVPVAVHSWSSGRRLSSPGFAPKLSSSACSETQRLGFFPETCVFSRPGPHWWFAAGGRPYWSCVALVGLETPTRQSNVNLLKWHMMKNLKSVPFWVKNMHKSVP